VVMPDLRERNRARTRSEIQEAAFGLFTERGFDAVTVEEIAAAGGVSPATFFRYFRSKEDVAFWDEYDLRVAEFLRDRPGEEPIDTLSDLVLELLPEVASRDEGMLQRSKLIYRTPALRSRLYDRRHEVADELAPHLAANIGCSPDDLGLELVLNIFFDVIYVSMDRWQASDGVVSLHELGDDALRLLRRGLRMRPDSYS
jgi:AcrR family transcriptional regulator